MRYLGDRLHEAGFSVQVVRLAGHGTSAEDMEGVTRDDWYASVLSGLDDLAEVADDIVVIGQSMGSLLSLKLAAEHPERVRALVLLAPALLTSMAWLPWAAPLIPFVLTAFGERYRFVQKDGGSDIADDEARAVIPSYPKTPLRSVVELVKLQENVRPLVARIEQPAMIVHSIQDHTCPIENLSVLQRTLPSPVRCLVLRDSFHVVSIDKDRDRVAAEVTEFVTACATTTQDRSRPN